MIDFWVTRILLTHPVDSLSLETPRDLWFLEGVEIAQHAIYSDIKPDEKPSIFYLERGELIGERQIAKAGYRLANVLNEIWSVTKEDEVFL